MPGTATPAVGRGGVEGRGGVTGRVAGMITSAKERGGGKGKRPSQDQAKIKAKINTKTTKIKSKQPNSLRNKQNWCKQWQLIVVK